MALLDGIPVDIQADIPDTRDRIHEPSLGALSPRVDPPASPLIREQGTENIAAACALAAVVDNLNRARGGAGPVSVRMLHAMGRKHDSWPGQGYAGTSCRSVLKGWFHSGACSERLWPMSRESVEEIVTPARAADARMNPLASYHRIKKRLADMHAALNEVGALLVSARIHRGWARDALRSSSIPMHGRSVGTHAFAIVGYDETGFRIQNSWGPEWGDSGMAHWSYADWQANGIDCWVVRQGLGTPGFEGSALADTVARSASEPVGPRRHAIAGHFVHVDDGRFQEHGRYWSDLADVRATAEGVTESEGYEHLVLHAHGALGPPHEAASHVARVKEVFKANGIYPFHFLFDTGILQAVQQVISSVAVVDTGPADKAGAWADRRFERAVRPVGRALWREMKRSAAEAFRTATTPGSQAIEVFLRAMDSPSATFKKVHLVGHGAGAILFAHLLQALQKLGVQTRIFSVSLLAPALTMELYESCYLPLLKASPPNFGIDALNVYCLDERLERADQLEGPYKKSLLHLVSRSFEEKTNARLLGMKEFHEGLAEQERLELIYSHGAKRTARSMATSHDGFESDAATLNDVMKTILGRDPDRQFVG